MQNLIGPGIHRSKPDKRLKLIVLVAEDAELDLVSPRASGQTPPIMGARTPLWPIVSVFVLMAII